MKNQETKTSKKEWIIISATALLFGGPVIGQAVLENIKQDKLITNERTEERAAEEKEKKDTEDNMAKESDENREKAIARSKERAAWVAPDWYVQESVNPIDDSPAVALTSFADDYVYDKFGRKYKAKIVIRCLRNTTNMYINFGGLFMADINGYGNVTMRVDDNQAFARSMRESTDHESLGLWSGGQSIPVVKKMFNADTLLVQATPYSESKITMTFSISDLQDRIKPLRQACHW